MRAIVVGTRGSQLALVQTDSVVARIRELHPEAAVTVRKIVTAGDRDRQTSLEHMGTDVFVKELEEALLDGGADLAVHCLKDLPTALPAGLRLLAVPQRADPRDALVARARLEDLSPGARIGTDSPRRALLLGQTRPDLSTCSVRGNIDTRLKKVDSREVDGIVMAAAALERLGWTGRITQYLDILPAAGQGALAIEGRADDQEMTELCSKTNSVPEWQSVTAERAFLAALGGGCRAPIAALGKVDGGILRLEGLVAGITSHRIVRGAVEGRAESAQIVGLKLALKLTRQGAADLVAEAVE